MKTTLQMEFMFCQAPGLLSQAKGTSSMGKLLALLYLWGVVRLGVRNETGCDWGITCSAIAVGADSTHSGKKRQFREIHYLHPSIEGLQHESAMPDRAFYPA